MFFALVLAKPQVLIFSLSSPSFKDKKALGVWYSGKIWAVTLLTRTSVHWAESMVATKSSKGLLKFNPQTSSP